MSQIYSTSVCAELQRLFAALEGYPRLIILSTCCRLYIESSERKRESLWWWIKKNPPDSGALCFICFGLCLTCVTAQLSCSFNAGWNPRETRESFALYCLSSIIVRVGGGNKEHICTSGQHLFTSTSLQPNTWMCCDLLIQSIHCF